MHTGKKGEIMRERKVWLKKLKKVLKLNKEGFVEGWICLTAAKQNKHWEILTPGESYKTFWDNHVRFLRALDKESLC